MKLPQAFKRITLHLARSKDFPAGSSRHGYEFVVPLESTGHIDIDLWRKHRDGCRVRRFWDGSPDQTGRLTHKSGGAEHARWVFDYDEDRVDDDEAGYRFGGHVFVQGKYVSITEDDGDVHTFRVMAVEPAA